MDDGSLRERLIREEAARVRKHLAPALRDMTRAAELVSTNAQALDEAASLLRRSRWERLLSAFLVGALLLFLALFAALPRLDPHRGLTDAELRRLRIGEQLERNWDSLSASDRSAVERALK